MFYILPPIDLALEFDNTAGLLFVPALARSKTAIPCIVVTFLAAGGDIIVARKVGFRVFVPRVAGGGGIARGPLVVQLGFF
jgi:hypothetical protein